MLVLTRRQGESVRIGADNKITVCIIYKTQIKLEINDSEVVTIKLQGSIISTNPDPDFYTERLLRYVPDACSYYGQGPQLFCRP